jgi:hypothetical protein
MQRGGRIAGHHTAPRRTKGDDDMTNTPTQGELADFRQFCLQASPVQQQYIEAKEREAGRWAYANVAREVLGMDLLVVHKDFDSDEPDEPELKTFTVRIMATARVETETEIDALTIEDAIKEAKKIDPTGYRYAMLDNYDIEGDAIAFVSDMDDGDEHEIDVDLRPDGECFSWDACAFVDDIAKEEEPPRFNECSRDKLVMYLERYRILIEKARALKTKGQAND